MSPTSTTKSPLTIVPLREAMLPEVVNGYVTAFQPNPANRVMLPTVNDETRAFLTENKRKSLLKDPAETNEHYMVIIDTSLPSTNPGVPEGVVVGHGVWKLEKEGDIWTHPAEEIAKTPGGNRDAFLAFFPWLDSIRNTLVGGKRLWHLTLLYTDPSYPRRGAGRAFVEWGIQRADEMGLEAYLDATAAGKPLYAKCGFEELRTDHFDLTPFGGEGVYTSYAMLRKPRKIET